MLPHSLHLIPHTLLLLFTYLHTVSVGLTLPTFSFIEPFVWAFHCCIVRHSDTLFWLFVARCPTLPTEFTGVLCLPTAASCPPPTPCPAAFRPHPPPLPPPYLPCLVPCTPPPTLILLEPHTPTHLPHLTVGVRPMIVVWWCSFWTIPPVVSRAFLPILPPTHYFGGYHLRDPRTLPSTARPTLVCSDANVYLPLCCRR